MHGLQNFVLDITSGPAFTFIGSRNTTQRDMLRTTLNRVQVASKLTLPARGISLPTKRFYRRQQNESEEPEEVRLRTLHPFLKIHDATRFATNFLTVETESGRRDFEDREKFRDSVAAKSLEQTRLRIRSIQSRTLYMEGLDQLFAKAESDGLIKLHEKTKTASLEELKEICNNINTNAVLGDQYSGLPNYSQYRKSDVLSVLVQNIIFRYQKLTVEAGEPLDADPLFKLVAYVYGKATEDVKFTGEAADALLWAACNSGTIDDIIAVVSTIDGMGATPSTYTVSEALVPALRPLAKIRDVEEKVAYVISLAALRTTFCKDPCPKTTRLMFQLCSRLDEFASAFKIAKQVHGKKDNRPKRYEEAASAMLKAAVRCTKNEAKATAEQDDIFVRFEVTRPYHQAMANMFVVARFLRHVPNASLPQDAVETALVLCAREGNVVGLNKVLSWTDTVSKKTTERVLALFPYAHGMAEEPMSPSIDLSSMFQETSYVGHINFLEELKQKTEDKSTVAEIDEKLNSIN